MVNRQDDLEVINEFEDADELADEIQLVSFKLGAEEYGVDIMQVQEIIRLVDIVRVPKAPAFVEGIIDLRNKVVPIIDLRKRFELPATEKTDASRIVVINIEDMTVGLIVDAVSEVLRIPVKSIEPPPRIVAGIESRFLKGIGRVKSRLLILLDLARIFSMEEMADLGEVEQLAAAEEGQDSCATERSQST